MLLVIGGLNWLLVGLFSKDLFTMLGWDGGWVARIVYILVGLSALSEVFGHKGMCKNCTMGGGMNNRQM